MTDVQREQNKEMIGSPGSWPQWPFLPIKRNPIIYPEKDIGLIFDHPGPIHVLLANLWDFRSIGFDRAKVEKLEYANADALLADGWQVD